MNESIKKALLKQKIRRSHIINLKEQATLYSTFIEPFSDAISAVKLGSQEVLSAARLAWDTITLSPKKMEEALKNHESRMDSIKQNYHIKIFTCFNESENNKTNYSSKWNLLITLTLKNSETEQKLEHLERWLFHFLT